KPDDGGTPPTFAGGATHGKKGKGKGKGRAPSDSSANRFAVLDGGGEEEEDNGAGAAAAAAAAAPRVPDDKRLCEEDSRILRQLRVSVAYDGIVALGVPIGTEAYVRRQLNQRLCGGDAGKLLERLVLLDDVQGAFALLRLSGAPRPIYNARTVPPSAAAPEFELFDALTAWVLATLIWRNDPLHSDIEVPSFADFVSNPDVSRLPFTPTQLAQARLPARLCGLGVMSASAISPAAFVASMAGAIPKILARLPPLQAEALRDAL
ncbi:unnamed protein product, partial [Phaeothamnion confervicola]